MLLSKRISMRCRHILLALIVLWSVNAEADSVSGLIDRGNSSWLAGEYDMALKYYEEAEVESPESPYIYFNKGTVLYSMGNYSAAMESFEKAALASKDLTLEAKSRYNLGNCAFKEAERQQDSDLKKSLEYCEKSIAHFQEALRLDSSSTQAAENMEIVRLFMKNILDELKKREQEEKEKQKAAQEFAEKLKQVIQRQEEALAENLNTKKQIKEKGLTSEVKDKAEELAGNQAAIKDDTKKLADEAAQFAANTPEPQENPIETHLKNGVKEQEAAEGNLNNTNMEAAAGNQEKALRELKDALESMKKPQNNQQGQDQNQGDRQQEEQSDQQGRQEEQNEQGENSDAQEGQESEQGEEAGEQQEAVKLTEDAADILKEEQENKEKRNIRTRGSYRDVERDW